MPIRLPPILLAAAVLVPGAAAAQARFHPRWEATGRDFRPDGVWRSRARHVTRARLRLLARGDYAALNAPVAGAALIGGATAAALGGTLAVPAVLFSYPGVDSTQFMRDPGQYQAALFGPVPPAGLPYSLRSFYTELSNGLLDVPGQMVGWARLDSAESAYTGGESTACQFSNPIGASNCNGIFSGTAFTRMQNGLIEALAKVDPGVDFAQYDNDGPDGVANSGDDDGVVDVIAFLHATRDGACASASNGHLWAHRAVVSYGTDDASALGGTIQVRDYILQSGLGGTSGCDSTQMMAIGTMAHELGHGLGLPDLYDTSQQTEGIGQWGLMGSGNWASQRSPSRMEAWSLNELGWVAVRELTTAGTYALGAAPTADTALLVRAQAPNPRGEYFLLENRQPVLADTAVIRLHCDRSGNPPGCGGGLLIWHVDSIKTRGGAVNAGVPHGVALRQADGLSQLDLNQGGNRGDAGDPYPGVAANRAFSAGTNPAATRNADQRFAGVAVDSIRQTIAGGEMAFRLRFGGVTIVRGSDTAAVVVVGGDTVRVFRDLVGAGDTVSVAAPDTQMAANGRTRWRFVSWSDGQARLHAIVGSAAGDTLIATLARDFRVAVTVQGGGTVTATPAIDLAGALVAEGAPVGLVATPGAGSVFVAWTGDTSATSLELSLPLGRPYALVARFDPLPALATSAVVAHLLRGSGPLTADQLRYLDLLGNRNAVFDVGDFRAWVDATGAVVTGAAAALVSGGRQ